MLTFASHQLAMANSSPSDSQPYTLSSTSGRFHSGQLWELFLFDRVDDMHVFGAYE